MSVKIKIIVINEVPKTLGTTREWLESAGYEVIVRNDAAIGTLNLIAQVQPELVLFDVNMPTMSGAALAKLIERNPKLPRASVVFYSSQNQKALEDLVWETGALGAIVKTENSAAFLADVRTLLRRKTRISSGLAMKPLDSAMLDLTRKK
jgi:DNA-binding NarL/FixJ family response regulator